MAGIPIRSLLTLLVPVIGAAVGVLPAGEAQQLLRRSDAGLLAPSSFRARLALIGPSTKGRHEIEVWRSGESMLVRFLDAKERGKYLVQAAGGQWLIAPGARKPVRLKTSYRLYGGVTLEQIWSIPLERTYTIASAVRESDPGGELVVFELEARTPEALFPRARYVVRAAAERPTSALYRLRSGREAVAIEFFDWTGKSGAAYARRVILRDLLRKGAATEVVMVELEPRPVSPSLFDLDDAAARRSLEAESAPPAASGLGDRSGPPDRDRPE